MSRRHCADYSRQTACLVGEEGVDWVEQNLIKRGYSVHRPEMSNARSCDLLVSGLPVEVKFSTQSTVIRKTGTTYNRYAWFVRSIPENTNGVVFLVAKSPMGKFNAFIMPFQALADKNGLSIKTSPEKHRGWMAKDGYLNNWSIVDDVIKSVSQSFWEVPA